ncbi:polynucleotide adenylyltransferase PcnB [Aquabacterium sp.]|uniref:polynucleotide adenylyltransferase PcnB n=1 Tax=Aquabacterium sp. TaxID=1872578 RepID=UPI0035AE1DE8
MIKKFISSLLTKRRTAASPVKHSHKTGHREDIPHRDHGIDLSLVDDRAVKVVETLQQAGFEAYIVGGAVRDLLLGLRPKDFDVATNATPEEVKGLFRRAFIIGRRFRIVHVVYGRGREHEVIEVSTFRAHLDAADAEQVAGNEKTSRAELAGKSHVVDASGRVLRDNVWGPQIEDAARRDFTVNALYYDPRTQIVVDYHHGLRDAKKRVLRMIGDPETRYREDPVRIIRVVRFAAKLGFEIDAKTREPIKRAAAWLDNVPQSRLFDEMIKLLQTGHAQASVEELRKQGLDRGVFPVLEAALIGASPARQQFVQAALADTDRRVGEGKPVAPSFLLACLLWHDVLDGWQRLKSRGEAPFPALQQAIDTAFDSRIGDISGRGKLAADMREIWMMQPRFDKRVGNGPFTLVEQPRFRAGFDFLRLRAQAGEIDAELGSWWEAFSLAELDERKSLLEQVRPARTAVRSPRKPAASGGSPAVADAEESSADPAKKRRRRRRKPAGQGSGEGGAGGEA